MSLASPAPCAKLNIAGSTKLSNGGCAPSTCSEAARASELQPKPPLESPFSPEAETEWADAAAEHREGLEADGHLFSGQPVVCLSENPEPTCHDEYEAPVYEDDMARQASDEVSYGGFSEVQAPGDTEVIYVREGVSVWPTRRETIEGRLTLIKQHRVMFLAWLPYTHGTLNQDGTFNVLPQAQHPGSKSSASQSDRTMYAVHPIPLSEIKAIRKHVPTLGWHYLCVVLVNGLTLPPLYFNNGGVRAFLGALKQHAFLIKSIADPTTYLVNDTVDPLQRSLTSLELADVLIGAPPPGASSTWAPGQGGWYTGDVHTSFQSSQPFGTGSALTSMSSHIIEQFSRVARMARDTTSSLFVGEDGEFGSGSPRHTLPTSQACIQEPLWRKAVNVRNCGVASSSKAAERSDSGEEASTSVGVFELVDQQVDLAAASRARVRPPPLGLEEWSAFLDSDGRLKNDSGFRQRVFYSGLSPTLRKEAWKFLLHLYPNTSTAAERATMAAERREEYESLKQQWANMSSKQIACFSKWRERLTRVDKDVHRTDRSHPFFSGEGSSEHLQQLRAILLTYCMYNFDLGYCQGMSDLAAPILVVMQNEADAFWCFVALMERMQANFHTDQTGMHNQLLALRKLVMLLDPQLYSALEERDCLNFFFCFRWVLIQFKREFEFDQVLRLWEALWTHHLSDHFHLYLCVAILEQHRRTLLQEEMDFDGILKLSISLSGRIDLDSVLKDAEALCIYAGDVGKECLEGLP